MRQEYQEFYQYLKDNNLLNSKHNLIGGNASRKLGLKKERANAEKQLISLTSLLPADTPNEIRMRYIRLGVKPEDNLCPVCGDQKKWSNGGHCFQLTCGKDDHEHKQHRRPKSVKTIKTIKNIKPEKPVPVPDPRQAVKKALENQRYIELKDSITTVSDIKEFSDPVKEIVEYIRELDPETTIISPDNNLINRPLSIYLPEYNLAIEYSDLLEKSQGPGNDLKNRNARRYIKMQLIKTDMCELKNTALLHIFENEWITKKSIWKSVIKNKMHKNSRRLFARKLEVIELGKKHNQLVSQLFEENHLQGAGAIGGIRFGLILDNELISVMTFGQSRFHKETVYELIRFATVKNTSVAGGASKLLKAFERTYNPKKLVSYANRRWSDGNLYHKLGFDLSHISEPNYFYYLPSNKLRLWSRNHFQRHKLEGYFGKLDKDSKEVEVMFSQGYWRIFDSGNHCFVKKYKERK